MNNLVEFLLSKPAHRQLRRAGSLLALGGLLAPLVVMAQGPQSGTGPAASRAASIDEVVVTARRRTESLDRVPISITAIGAEQLLERSIRTDSDLQFGVPGLTIRQTQGNNSLTYSIRGQTADTFSGSPSAVIAYLNEVPLTVAGASSFYDLESVQVLKGPQGTLFGRNTTGGAVLYTSARPSEEDEGLVRVRAGNLGLREVEGMLNVPIVEDRVLLRGAVNVIERDGYIRNLLSGEDLGEIDRRSGRLSLTLRPSDRLENTSVFQYGRNKSTNTGASYTYSVYQCGDTNNGFALTCDSGLLFSPDLDSVFGPGSWDDYLAANPDAFAPGLPAYVDEQRRIGPYRTRHPGGADHDGREWMLTNTTAYELNPQTEIRNILGISRAETRSEQPQLGAPFLTILTANIDSGESGNELKVESYSNELQLQGNTAGGALDYIVGLYLQTTQTDTIWPQTYFDVRPVISPVAVTNAFRLNNDTYALYGQGTYDLAPLTSVDGLRVTAGLRYTWERVEIQQLSRATFTSGAPDQSENFSRPSWELGLEYDISDSLFSYLKTRGSFRSGGFNGAAPPVDAGATGGGNKFKSETIVDVEAGLRFRGDVAGRPASLAVSVYQQWIDEVQRVEFPADPTGVSASIAVTANVPEAKVRGVELESSILPAPWLMLGLSGAYTDAKFTDGDINLFGDDFRYGPVADTPKYTGSLWAQVDVPTPHNFGDLRFRAEFYAQSSMYFSNAANSISPDTKLPGYELLNARLDWSNIMGSDFSAALFGKNLADEEHFVGGMTLAAALGHNAAAVGEPRTYGLELSYQF